MKKKNEINFIYWHAEGKQRYHCLLTVLDMPFLTRHLSTSITYVELEVKKYNKVF